MICGKPKVQLGRRDYAESSPALLASLRALEGDTRARIENFERAIKSFFLTCEADLTPEECVRFRHQAQITMKTSFIGSISMNIRTSSVSSSNQNFSSICS